MTGVRWVPLPADAPEPPPLSVVRDKDGDTWLRIHSRDDEPWRIVMGGQHIGLTDTWPGVAVGEPLELAEAEGDTPEPPVEHSETMLVDAFILADRLAARLIQPVQMHVMERLLAAVRDLAVAVNVEPPPALKVDEDACQNPHHGDYGRADCRECAEEQAAAEGACVEPGEDGA